jgi:hypothetical protein
LKTISHPLYPPSGTPRAAHQVVKLCLLHNLEPAGQGRLLSGYLSQNWRSALREMTCMAPVYLKMRYGASATCTTTTPPTPVLFYALARRYFDRRNRPIAQGLEFILHLHRFQYDHRLALLHRCPSVTATATIKPGMAI